MTTGASRSLFEVRGRDLVSLAVDPSGRHVLVVMHTDTREGVWETRLYRWSRGGRPIKVVDGVFDADWVPER